MKRLFTIIIALITLFNVAAQNPVGTWAGKLNVAPSVSLRLVLIIEYDGDKYNSQLISIDQGNAIINSVNTTITDNKLTTTFSTINAKYIATISESELNGTFTQSGQQFHLVMIRADEETKTGNNPPQTPKAPFPYNTEEVTFINRIEGNILSGTLTTPKDTNCKVPAVLLVSGSGSQNRDSEIYGHKPFWVIADYLTRNGIAVLRYDDRAVGSSGIGNINVTTADLAYDAEAGVEYLRSRNEFSSVGVIGHSEGGTIAFILAGDSNYQTPDFIISMAGAALTGAEILTYQNDYALSQIDIPDNDKTLAMATNRAIYNAILDSEELNSDVIKAVTTVVENSVPTGTNPEAAAQQVTHIVKQVTTPWTYRFIKFDPRIVIENIKIPVLALNGSLDRQVESKSNLETIQSALNRGGNNSYKVIELNGLNHLFQKAETGSIAEYAQIEETINLALLKNLTEWINGL